MGVQGCTAQYCETDNGRVHFAWGIAETAKNVGLTRGEKLGLLMYRSRVTLGACWWYELRTLDAATVDLQVRWNYSKIYGSSIKRART